MTRLRTLVSRSLFVLTVFAAAASAADRPLPLAPTHITLPPPGYNIFGAAFEGEWMVAAASAEASSPGSDVTSAAALLYRRSGLGPWTFQRVLAEVPYFWDWNSITGAVAMENGILAFELDGELHIHERTVGGYTESAVLAGDFDSAVLRIDGQRILAGLGNCNGAATVEKNSAGQWAVSGRLQTANVSCNDDFSATESLDLWGNYAMVATRSNAYDTQVFRRVAGQFAWPRTGVIPPHDLKWVNTAVALRDPFAIVTGDESEGARLFRRADASGATWNRVGTLRTVDLYSGSRGHVGDIRQRYGFWLLGDDVWRQNADDSFQHLARLEGRRFGGDIDTRTVVAAHADGLATYIMPAAFPPSPETLSDDFQGGGNISWQIGDGFTYAQSGFTRVLRSTEPNVTREAIVTGADWLNQSIQVDVKPTGFDRAAAYVALSVRRVDAGNLYQVRFTRNRATLYRRTSGEGDVELSTAGVPFVANQVYRLRFETRGSLLRVYMDGARILSASDRALDHGGASLTSSMALADFDNVIVSPITTTLFGPSDIASTDKWTVRGGTWTDEWSSSPRARRQTDRTATARSLTGVSETDDQFVETSVRITSLPPDGDRWVGVIARYQDDSNYYYAALRVNSGLQIWRVLNGVPTMLARAPTTAVTVVGNQNYRLRLEAVGDQLRAYVDGDFLAEVRDSALASGRFGIATNRAAAAFFEMDVLQP